MRTIAVTWCACIAGCHVAAYGPTDITVTMLAPPSLVAFRDDSVDWTAVTPTGDPFVITVHGPYQVVVVCDYGEGFADIYRTAQTPDDVRTVDTPCYPLGGSHHDVTGTMVQPGHVVMGAGPLASDDANWSFDLDLYDDTYDLLAYTTDHVAVRRGIEVASAVALSPAVDVVHEGAPFDVLSVTATNQAPDETVATRVLFSTISTYARIYEGALDAVPVVPQSLVMPSDIQLVIVESDDAAQTHGRSVSHTPRDGGPTMFALPEALRASLDLGDAGVTASWSSLPDYDTFELIVDQSSDRPVFDELVISASYLAQTGVDAIAIDPLIPGFQPQWTVDPSSEYTRTFSGYSTTADGHIGAYVADDLNATVRAWLDRAATVGSDRARSRRTGS